ncbi:MAG: hypothetical protein M1840_002814 [Geoglossum simile]|nr:MAG: hypothetical protein M1840_002814 [Geoglossum simile]
MLDQPEMPEGPTLSIADFERAVAALLSPIETKQSHFADSDFDALGRLLFQVGKPQWSYRPRTYAVLRMIDRVDLFDAFILEGLKDIAFPYVDSRLPTSLNPTVKVKFLQAQKLVLTKASDLEKSDGRHRHLDRDADAYFYILRVLGRGGFGEVDHVRSKLSLEEYARKRTFRRRVFSRDKEAINTFENELTNLKRLSHHHLVKFVGSYTDPKFIGLLMSPVADCDLKAFLERDPFPKDDLYLLRGFFGCLCSAVLYLHNSKCRHKDLKPGNILVYMNKVLITDFGTARDWSEQSRSTTVGRTGAYTPGYAAPEVVDQERRSSSADIWSLGCVYLDIATVLRGETMASKSSFFSENGTGGANPRSNPEALELWLARLKSETDSQPLEWVKQMIRRLRNERVTAAGLMDQIHRYEDGHVYYNSCCNGEEESEDGTSYQGSVFEEDTNTTKDSENTVVKEDAAKEPKNSVLEGDASATKDSQGHDFVEGASATKDFKNSVGSQADSRAGNTMASLLDDPIVEDASATKGFKNSVGSQEDGRAGNTVASLLDDPIVEDASATKGFKDSVESRADDRAANTLMHSFVQYKTAFQHSEDVGVGDRLDSRRTLHPATSSRPKGSSQSTEKLRSREQSLHQAAASGNFTAVKELLEQGYDINLEDAHGSTPLDAAIKSLESGLVVGLLLMRGARSCSKNTKEQIRSLVENGAVAMRSSRMREVKEWLGTGDTPYRQSTSSRPSNSQLVEPRKVEQQPFTLPQNLHHAAASGDFTTVKILLGQGWDSNLKDAYGNTPLDAAIKSPGNGSIIGLLLGYGARACSRSTKDQIRSLVENGTVTLRASRMQEVRGWLGTGDFQYRQITFNRPSSARLVEVEEQPFPLHHAAASGDFIAVKKLLVPGWDSSLEDAYGNTPLDAAIKSPEKGPIIGLLLGYGARACSNNTKDQIRLLVQNGSVSLRASRMRAVDEWLRTGASQHRQNISSIRNSSQPVGRLRAEQLPFPLHHAAASGDFTAVKNLLEKGWDPSLEDAYGNTPLDAAIKSPKNVPIIGLLLGYGARACSNNTKDQIRLLVQNGSVSREVDAWLATKDIQYENATPIRYESTYSSKATTGGVTGMDSISKGRVWNYLKAKVKGI